MDGLGLLFFRELFEQLVSSFSEGVGEPLLSPVRRQTPSLWNVRMNEDRSSEEIRVVTHFCEEVVDVSLVVAHDFLLGFFEM
jgi:hypothetical protein